ncbi:hypothetical protein HMY34_14410 [Thiothrix subterranea]|uniref:hypothetical protein n=1 Tax=Thiothrix subterranea TaxID=2735563 RepID=UPI00192C16C6|nr:hypothetical protein [Thiothrix subterranea]QQZ29854.1 hypothetical protein HMY34_14410 [Thiothrix subterranea]
MKKLIAGLGLTVLAVPSAQAWSMDDSRTVHANKSQPIVRVVKHYQTATLSCEQCQVSQGRTQRHSHQATGWQRSARVTPQRMQRPHQAAHVPIRPVQMHAYYVPQRHHAAKQPLRVHRIVGQAQPMCRYIR